MRRTLLIAATYLLAGHSYTQPVTRLHPQTQAWNNHFFVTVPNGSEKFYVVGSEWYTSADEGVNWAKETYSLKMEFRNLFASGIRKDAFKDACFTDENTGFIVDRSTILKTTNKGATWKTVASLQPNTRYSSSAFLEKIFFIDNSTGFAVGTFDKILKTKDGGETWTTLQWSNSSAPYTRLHDVYFHDENNGMIAGYTVDDIQMNFGMKYFIKTTSDGGKHWQTTYMSDDYDYERASISVINQQTSYVLLQGDYYVPIRLIRSTDGGQHWNVLPLPMLLYYASMAWTDAATGFITGAQETYLPCNTVLQTTDSGKTWTVQTLHSPNAPYNNSALTIAFSGKNHGVIAGENGAIFRTENGGQSWHAAIPAFGNILDIRPLSDQWHMLLHGGIVLQSADLQNWQPLHVSSNDGIIKWQPISNTEAYFINDYGELIRYTSNGQQYTTLIPKGDTACIDLQYDAATSTCWVAGFAFSTKTCFVLKLHTQQQTRSYHSVFSNEGSRYIIRQLTLCNNGEAVLSTYTNIYASTGKGSTWNKTFATPVNISINAVSSTPGSGRLHLVNTQHELYYSDNGGHTWKKGANLPTLYELQNFIPQFVTDQYGFAVGGARKNANAFWEAVVLETTNGGNTWSEIQLPLIDGPLTGVQLSHNTALFYGKAGTVLQKQFAAPPPAGTGVQLKVYPNPTSGKIFVEHPYAGLSLSLYDATGKLLQQFHKVKSGDELDLGSYASGVYMLRATTAGVTVLQQVLRL